MQHVLQILQTSHSEETLWNKGKFITALWHPCFFFTRNTLLTNSSFELFWWLLLSTFLLPPDSLILPFHDSQLVGKGYLTVKVLNEMGFCILLLCPKPCDPVLFSCRLLQNFSIFLLMERLGCFLTTLIFLSIGGPFLISTELAFLNSNTCWRRFAVEQIYRPYLCCWLPFSS